MSPTVYAGDIWILHFNFYGSSHLSWIVKIQQRESRHRGSHSVSLDQAFASKDIVFYDRALNLIFFSPYNRRLKCRDWLSVLSRFSVWRQLSTKVNWLDPIKQHWDWHDFQVTQTKRGWRHRLRRSDLSNSLTLCLKACLIDWKASWSFLAMANGHDGGDRVWITQQTNLNQIAVLTSQYGQVNWPGLTHPVWCCKITPIPSSEPCWPTQGVYDCRSST